MRGAAYLPCLGVTSDSCARFSRASFFGLRRQATTESSPRHGAELLGERDAVDRVFLVTRMFHKVAVGDCSVDGALQRRASGGYSIPHIVYRRRERLCRLSRIVHQCPS